MLTSSSEHPFVAQLTIPSRFFPTGETRRPITNPQGFEISKGYYIVQSRDRPATLSGYTDLVLVIEFVSSRLREAEEHALKVGRMFSSLVSAYGAYPLESPRLQRLASMEITGDLLSEHGYSHRAEPYMLSAFDQTVDHQLQQYLRSISSIDDNAWRHVQLAIHWYGISLSTSEPTVSYVAAWTGLECIGTVLDGLAHPNGPKAPCQTCNNKPGDKRDRKLAGIQHMFHSLSKGPLSSSLSDEARERLSRELRMCFSPKDAHELRSSIVHGLEGLESLSQESSDLRLHLIHALNASIQTILGRQIRSWLPGSDYGVHPDFRHSLKFKRGLKISPYQGEWVSELHSRSESSTEGYGNSPIGVQGFELAVNSHAAEFVEFKSEEIYKRDDAVYKLPDDPDWQEYPSWFDRTSEPEWREFNLVDDQDPKILPGAE